MVSISSKSEVFEFSRGGGGQKPPIRGLHATCDAHFRTQMSYSSQKLCVKIWFGLVEPFKSYDLNFLGGWGGQKPPIRGLHVTCDTHFRTWPSFSSQKSYGKIWFGLVEPFKSYHVHKHFSGGGGRKILFGRIKIWFGLVEPFKSYPVQGL